jgi:hypothetical protein
MKPTKLLSFSLLFLALAMDPVASGQAFLCGTNYTQNFNTLGNGLPPGWSVRTNATASSLGTAAEFNANCVSWANKTGQFGNGPSLTNNAGVLATGSASDTQATFTNRLLLVRQAATFYGSDPGAAFVFQIANTAGLSNFTFGVDLDMLSVQDHSTTWTLDYAVGNAPAAFTVLGTFPDPGVLGTTRQTCSLGADANNQTNNVWIRIVALTASAGTSGARDTFGIDDFILSCAGTPAAIPLCLQPCGTNLVLTWTDSTYALQSAPTAAGTFTNVPGATSPFTNALAEPAKFFRLCR